MATNKPMYTVEITNEEVAKLNELLPGWGFVPEKMEEGEFGLSTGGGYAGGSLRPVCAGGDWTRKSYQPDQNHV